MRDLSTFPKLKGKALLSPMAGVTDVAFRALAKKYGAALTCTEFLNSTAIVRKNKRTLEMLQKDPSEKPAAVQLFGNKLEDVIAAAQYAQKTFDIIDVNCGCPAWKVIKTGSGSAMLNDPARIATFINKLVTNVSKPVTLKIRSGIDKNKINAIEIAKKAEDAGAAAIAIHGRTQKQGYSGVSDWDIIKKVKETVNIPVIGNGDVFTPEVFKQRLEESKVDYILIARAAMNNPYIFQQIQDFQKKGTYKEKNKIEQFLEVLTYAKKYNIGCPDLKNHAIQFTKGMQGGAELRRNLSKITTIEELEKLMHRQNH